MSVIYGHDTDEFIDGTPDPDLIYGGQAGGSDDNGNDSLFGF